MATLQGQSTTNATSVAQFAALAAVEGPADAVESMRIEFDRRRKLMLETLRSIPGLRCVEPKGAFYAFPDISAFLGKRSTKGRVIDDDVSLSQYLIEEAKVAVVPGSAFFAPGHIRLSYATSQALIAKGLQRMAQSLGELR
jgi:aspartate aminotransferase